MNVSRKYYSSEERLNILRDYYSSGMSLKACVLKYGLSHHSVLINWKKRYGNEKDLLSLQPELTEEEMANRSKEDYKKEIAELKKRNRDLEKALQFSRLETLARDLMIDKAEEYFDVPIRKKSGAKQL